MFWTFLYVARCSMTNRLRRRLQRLREPRYLIGLIVGAVYFYLMFFRRGVRGPRGAAGPAMMAKLAGGLQLGGSVILMVVAAAAWVLPGAGTPIAFSRPEVQFFFTAPVTRRELLHYKLLRSQIGILISSAITTLVLRPASLGGSWMFLVGLWTVLVAVRLHLMGVALTRSSLLQHGRSAPALQWLPLAAVLGVAGALTAQVAAAWPVLAAMPDGGALLDQLQRLSLTGAAAVVLWPFCALVQLPLSASPAEFLSRLPLALGLVALNYVWVLRADASFEEASADHAEKQSRDRSAPRAVVRGAASAPFQLAPDGPAETAILWKNLILMGRYVSLRTLLRVLPIVVVFGLIARGSGAKGITEFLAQLCLPLAAFAILLGPQMMRNDLRQDLAQLALLKTWPVRGAAIIRGEVLAPTVVVTAVAWLLILMGALLLGEGSARSLALVPRLMDRVSYAAAALILAPALILSQTIVQNALAVIFPAWVRVGATRARGIDVMGQRLLLMGGNLLALALSLVPGAIAGGLAGLAIYALTGSIPVVLPAVLVAIVVFAEGWLATELLGRVLDRTDVSAVDAAES
jgi:hypothetical protein